jgi:ketosteroid isomerase-like protein
MMDDLYEVLDVIHFDVSEMRDLGDTVVAIGTMRTRGKVSGIETEEAYANVGRIRGGKGIRIRGYLDIGAALKDAES